MSRRQRLISVNAIVVSQLVVGIAALGQVSDVVNVSKGAYEVWRVAGLAGLAFVALAVNAALVRWLVGRQFDLMEASIKAQQEFASALRKLSDDLAARPCVACEPVAEKKPGRQGR